MKTNFSIDEEVLWRISDDKAPKGTIIGSDTQYNVRFEHEDGGHEYWLSEDELEHVDDTMEHSGDAEKYDKHYQGDIQPIELMQSAMSAEAFMGFLRGNIIKYACRLGKKDDVAKETTKILRYAKWLDKVAKGKKVNPRE